MANGLTSCAFQPESLGDERMFQEWKQMGMVALFGAAGAVLAVLASLLLNPMAEPVGYVLLLSTALGAGAGLVFVFAIANTDRTDRPRMLTLALVAGFFWEPVWEGARALVVSQLEEEKAAKAEQALDRAADLATQAASNRDAVERQKLIREMNGEISRAAVYVRAIDMLSGLSRAEAAAARLAVSLGGLPPPERRDAAELWERTLRSKSHAERFMLVPRAPESQEPP